MTIFQYFKYHSIGTNTDPNIKAAYYGAKRNGKGTHFVNYHDSCKNSLLNPQFI